MEQPARLQTTAPAGSPSEHVAVAPADFDLLYEQHFDVIWRLLQAVGVARANLDDAVQDVFLTAFRQLGRFEARSTFKTWLCGIACGVAANYRRRERRKGGLSQLEQEPLPARDPGPLEQLEQSRAWAILRAFLESLDEKKRNTYVLSRVEGLTAPEIADALAIPINTVYSRLHAVEAALGQFMADNHLREKDDE